MASARPPGGGGSTPRATVGFDYSQLRSAPQIARGYAQATTREISQAFKALQAEQRLAQTQAQQTLTVLRAQQSQITATTRAESSVRISAARAEGIAQQQAARAAAATTIEEQKRLTAQFKSELRAREAAERASRHTAASGGVAGTLLRGATSFAGALGVSVGIAGAVQGGRAAIDAAQTATAYDRQYVAARRLAGSQQVLNQLLAAYDKATGGAVDNATALADVTNLQAIGFAKNAQEMTRFVTAARGISIAKGTPLGETTNELALGIANQSTRRFDQLGLGVGEVNQRIAELRENNKGLTREMAFQEAVLQIAIEKYGELATGATGQKSGLENAAKAWTNYGLQVGQVLEGPLGSFGNMIADELDRATQRSKEFGKSLDELITRMREIGLLGKDLSGPISSRTSIGSNVRTPPQAFGLTPEMEGAKAVRLNWAQGITELNRQTHAEIIAEETSFGRNRSKTVADFANASAREAEDFGRHRLRAEAKLGMAILDVAQDSARQRVKWEQDLERNISQGRADSAEKVAELREDSAEKIAESEEKYAKDRLKRQRDLSDNLLDAAGHLDAQQVYELQRNFAKQEKEAEDAHKEQQDDLKKQLDERIGEEGKSLAKSERLASEANERRISEQVENDKLRIQEMKDAFAAQTAEEDIERGIMLGRRATDQAAQLVEMDTQHGLRLNQIRTNAIRERETLQLAADDALIALGAADAATQKRHEARELAVEKLWDKFHKHITDSLTSTTPRTMAGGPIKAYASGGYVGQTGLAYLHAGEYVMPVAPMATASGMGGNTNNSRSITIGNISVYGAPTDSPHDFAQRFRQELLTVLEEVT